MFVKLNRKLLCLLLLAGASAFAQTPIQLEEALQLAKQNNLQLQIQQQEKIIADLQLAIRKGQRLPALDLTASSTYTSEIATFDLPQALTGGRLLQIELGGHQRTELSLSLRQPLYTGARLKTSIALAENAVLSKDSQHDILQQAIRHQIETLFYRAQLLHREVKTQQASLDRVQKNLVQVRTLFLGAQAMAFDTLKIFNQKLQIAIEQDRLRKELRLLEIHFARTLDLPQPRPIAQIDLARPAHTPLALDSLKRVALQRRPETQAIRIGLQAARLQGKLARSAYFPAVSGVLSYNIGKPGLNQVANEWMDYFAAGVQVQWNLWRGAQDRHRIEQAEIEHNRLALEERELLKKIDADVEQAWENLHFSFKQLNLAEQLLAQQRERFRITGTLFSNGMATSQEITDAESELTQAELFRERVIVQSYLAAADLALATGTMLQHNP